MNFRPFAAPPPRHVATKWRSFWTAPVFSGAFPSPRAIALQSDEGRFVILIMILIVILPARPHPSPAHICNLPCCNLPFLILHVLIQFVTIRVSPPPFLDTPQCSLPKTPKCASI